MKKRLNIEIDENEHRKFKGKCSLEGKTITEKVIEWIRDFLRGEK